VPTLQRVSLERHLASCAAFAAETARIASMSLPHRVTKYEDFCNDPEPTLRAICETLQTPYDAEWKTRWATFDKVTGDTDASRGNTDPTIKPLTRRPIAEDVRRACLASADYHAACAAWGYPPED